MPDPATPHAVFVSHAHADNALADRYVAALRKHGLDVWYDRNNLQVGDSLSETIETQLRQRTALVVLYTPASIASRWVRREVAAFQRLADGNHLRRLMPVRAAECEMPLLMTDYDWTDAVSLGFKAGVEALTAALGATTNLTTINVASLLSMEEAADKLLSRARKLHAQARYREAVKVYGQVKALCEQITSVYARSVSADRNRFEALDGLALASQSKPYHPGQIDGSVRE